MIAKDVSAFTSWGAEPQRPQCGMKRGGSGLSKRAMQAAAQQRDYCEADRPKGDRWFESNCHHHLEALVDQVLPLFLPFGITAEGFTFFKVHLGDVNSSGHHSVHTVVWLSCRKIGVALLVESGKKASPKRCSGDALNLNNFRVIGSPVILQQSEKRICFN